VIKRNTFNGSSYYLSQNQFSMKRIFTTLALALAVSMTVTAQTSLYFDNTVFQSVNPGTTTITPHVGTIPGLSPSDSALPCSNPGVAVSDTIYFKNFTTFSVATVNSLKIDSLYLPAGLTWKTTSATNTFTTGQDGVILVEGTTNVHPGVYKLRIIVDVNTTIGNFSAVDAEALAHLRYHVRITAPGLPCPAIDPADSNSVYTRYAGGVGVNEVAQNISGLSVNPNPFSGTANVVFASEVEGVYTMKMTNLIGAVVSTKEVNVSTGTNELSISSNGISAGIYLLSLSNGQSSVTRKVVIK
jgi:hypothetical protein